MKQIALFAVIILVIIAGIFTVGEASSSKIETHNIKIELKDNKAKLDKLQKDFNENEQQVKDLEQQRKQLEEEKKSLEVKLQAKIELKNKVAIASAAPVSGTCGDNFYKQFIYKHESSCRLDAVNSIGCYGLGQDCNNVLTNHCPNWKNDFPCQDKFWEGYMSRRYGTWEKAYNFWQAKHWW